MSYSGKAAGKVADASHPKNVEHLNSSSSVVRKSGTWSTVADTDAMGMSYIQSVTVGDYVEFTFIGVGLWAYVFKSTDSGQIDVYIDDVLQQTLDLYSTLARRNVLWIAVGLDKVDATGKVIKHKCKIVVQTKSGSSSGNKVKLDGFEIEVDPGALQVLAFLEQTVATDTTITVPFNVGGPIISPTGSITVMLWQAPFGCTVTNVRGFRVGGTGATVNARKNQTSNLLAADLSLTSASLWMDAGAVQNATFVAGDSLEILLTGITGAVTQVVILVWFTRTAP